MERGRQLVFERGNPSEGLLWLHRAQAEGSKDAALPDLLASTVHAAGAPKAILMGHGGSVVGAMYSPDGRRIVTASWDKTARIWDVSPEARGPEQLAAFLRCHLPAQFDPNNTNIVIPRVPTAEDCVAHASSR